MIATTDLPQPTSDQQLVLKQLAGGISVTVEGTAGSGKTVLSALASGACKQRSAILTLTRSATAQINSRQKSGGDHYVETIHALAWRLVRSFGKYVGLHPNVRLDAAELKKEGLASQGDHLLSFDELDEVSARVVNLPGVPELFRQVFGQVILDESQDVSAKALEWLTPLLASGTSLIMYDPNQRLANDAPPIVQLLNSGRLRNFHQTMNTSLRCLDNVAAAARQVLAGEANLQRKQLFGGSPGSIGASLKQVILPLRSTCESVAVLAFKRTSVSRLSEGLWKETQKFKSLPHKVLGDSSESKGELLAAELLLAVRKSTSNAGDIAGRIVESDQASQLVAFVSKQLRNNSSSDRRVTDFFPEGAPPVWLSEERLGQARDLSAVELQKAIDAWQHIKIQREKHTVPRGVYVTTIASAKGREFDAVIILDDSADLFPSLGGSCRRRNAYVALTRARSQFRVIGPENRATGLFRKAG